MYVYLLFRSIHSIIITLCLLSVLIKPSVNPWQWWHFKYGCSVSLSLPFSLNQSPTCMYLHTPSSLSKPIAEPGWLLSWHTFSPRRGQPSKFLALPTWRSIFAISSRIWHASMLISCRRSGGHSSITRYVKPRALACSIWQNQIPILVFNVASLIVSSFLSRMLYKVCCLTAWYLVDFSVLYISAIRRPDVCSRRRIQENTSSLPSLSCLIPIEIQAKNCHS